MRTPCGRRRRMLISLSLSSSEILTPSTLDGIRRDDVDRDLHRLHVIRVAPVAFERRIEHLAEPVDDDRLLHLVENAVVDPGVVVRRPRGLHQRAARHQDDAAAELLDRGALLLVGADHVVDRDVRRRLQDDRCRRRSRSARRESPARRRACAGSVPARSASPSPCRAARCPSPRRRRGRATRDGAGNPWWCPSRSRHRARDRGRRADRPRRARPHRRRG